MQTKTQQQAAARAKLRELLPPGSDVNVILRHVSRTGMSRVIDALAIEDGAVRSIGWLFAQASPHWRLDSQREGIKVGGAGMDMGFHLVYSVAHEVWSDDDMSTRDKRRLRAWQKRQAPYAHQGDVTNPGYCWRHRWI